MRANLKAAPQLMELAGLSEQFGSDKTRYCPIYEEYFYGSRDLDLNFFEIGIGGHGDPQAGGASLRMWESYFPNAKIFALDYHDKQAHAAERVKVYQGSQDDKALLRRIADEIGRIDIVLDDGSHVCQHVIASFEALFPLLAPGGLYIVEDIGTSYWPDFGGSHDLWSKTTSMGYFKRLADGVNHPHIKGGFEPSPFDLAIRFVHFYENLVIIQKL
jgi:hypothetical protein